MGENPDAIIPKIWKHVNEVPLAIPFSETVKKIWGLIETGIPTRGSAMEKWDSKAHYGLFFRRVTKEPIPKECDCNDIGIGSGYWKEDWNAKHYRLIAVDVISAGEVYLKTGQEAKLEFSRSLFDLIKTALGG